MSASNEGTYLDKRRGVSRQCWSWCDWTPCRCVKAINRFKKKRWRQQDRAVIREQLT